MFTAVLHVLEEFLPRPICGIVVGMVGDLDHYVIDDGSIESYEPWTHHILVFMMSNSMINVVRCRAMIDTLTMNRPYAVKSVVVTTVQVYAESANRTVIEHVHYMYQNLTVVVETTYQFGLYTITRKIIGVNTPIKKY